MVMVEGQILLQGDPVSVLQDPRVVEAYLGPASFIAMPTALTVENLEVSYEPGLPIVRGANLTVEAGEILAVLGPNGAGKSSLAKALAGLAPITAGRNLLFGEDITRIPAHQMVSSRPGLRAPA